MVAAPHSRKANKAKMLVVDDEPDNLDLLYRTFRRDFNVLRAESGQQALNVLAEHGEVAVIISDQRMPEMKGTEFLSKTVPEFPDTVRIILTGFTDVEDLVDAINAGQVYRYITKPWDPDELKHVVVRAAETYELLKQRGDAIARSQKQHQLVMETVAIAQSASSLTTALPTLAEAIRTAVGSDGCVIHLVKNASLAESGGTAGNFSIDLLKQDPLVDRAIADQTLQFCMNGINHPDATVKESYAMANIQAHAVMPVLFRDQIAAIVSFQWEQPQAFPESLQEMMKLTAQQTGLTLASLAS